mgnify:CR=1 FL=1
MQHDAVGGVRLSQACSDPSKACFSEASTITDNFRLDSVVGPLGGILAARVRVAAPPRVDIKTSGMLCYDACGPH